MYDAGFRAGFYTRLFGILLISLLAPFGPLSNSHTEEYGSAKRALGSNSGQDPENAHSATWFSSTSNLGPSLPGADPRGYGTPGGHVEIEPSEI